MLVNNNKEKKRGLETESKFDLLIMLNSVKTNNRK